MDRALAYKTVSVECPRHAGSFNCESFCYLCEGVQEIPVSLTQYPGCLSISAMVDGYLKQERYLFFAEEDAIASFVEMIRGEDV